MPNPENVLCSRIRSGQLGVKFRRQFAFENRIFDFYAPQIKLAIEIDGESHFLDPKVRSFELQKDALFFKHYQITFSRFLNPEATFQTDEVLEEIARVIVSLTNPPSSHSANPLR